MTETESKPKSNSIIKHLVISGGGHSIFCTCGAFEELIKREKLVYSNIKTIYATSAGGIVGTIFCMNFDWALVVKDYMIKRPWHEAILISTSDIFAAYTKRGIFDKKYIEIIFKPLFSAKDLSMNITMKEFYEYSKIELHLFSLELHDFQTINISHKTHPNMELLTAVYMSSAFPILFAPFMEEGKYYMDGGIITNYPLQQCINDGHLPDEIIGFRNEYVYKDDQNGIYIDESSTILDYISCFLYKIIYTISTEHKQNKIANEVIYKIPVVSFFYMKKVMESQEDRKELWERGVNACF
jgi:predicted acylesterase/phospholipase RssA